MLVRLVTFRSFVPPTAANIVPQTASVAVSKAEASDFSTAPDSFGVDFEEEYDEF